MKYNEMSTVQVVQYVNAELTKNRTMKEIEEVDFGENKGVIQKRLNRKGYVKINNQFVLAKGNTTRDTTKIIQKENNNTTIDTTNIIQEKPSDNEEKKAFSNVEIDKLNKLLNLDINILDKMIQEYTTRHATNSSIEIHDKTTKVTSIRVNQELYNKIKEYSKENNINVGDIFNKMMMEFLMRNSSSISRM